MAQTNQEYARRDWKRVAQTTVIGTLGTVALSLFLNYLLLFAGGLSPFGHSLVSAAVLPVAIGAPLFFFVALKQREIRAYRRELNRAARIDLLTSCFNGSAFSAMVDAARPASSVRQRGAFLVVEAQHLKSINLQYGHQWGDEALSVIAAAIRSSVRAGDLVGRVAMSEFGVFLPGATEENAREVGERIRAAVAEVYFAPGGSRQALNVSAAGILFEDQVEFDQMFRKAEVELDHVQSAGLDKIVLAHTSTEPPPGLSAH